MARTIRSRRRRRRIKLAALASLIFAVTLSVGVGFAALDARKPSRPTAPTYAPTAFPTELPSDNPTAGPTTPAGPTLEARLAIIGDSGTRDANIRKTAAAIAAADAKGDHPFDALLDAGDLVYDKGEAKLTKASVIDPFAQTFTVNEIVPAIGNHDIDSGQEKEIMQQLGRSALTYATQVGKVRILVLDSNRVDTGQTRWLAAQLQQPQPSGAWTFALFHHSPFSSGMHGSDGNVRKRWVPLFATYKVALVISGHDHDYERSKPQDGVTYLVSGGSANLRSVGKSSFTAVSAKTLHFVDLWVYSDKLVGRAIDQDGKVFDQWTIPRPS